MLLSQSHCTNVTLFLSAKENKNLVASFLDNKDRGHRSPLVPPVKSQQHGQSYNNFHRQYPSPGQQHFQRPHTFSQGQYQGQHQGGRGKGNPKYKKQKTSGNYLTLCYPYRKLELSLNTVFSTSRSTTDPEKDLWIRIQPPVTVTVPMTNTVPMTSTQIPQVKLSDSALALLHSIQREIDNQPPFRAGALSEHLQEWAQLTTDNRILQIIEGFSFDFFTTPRQYNFPPQLIKDPNEMQVALKLIQELLAKRVIEPIPFPDPSGFISNIFLRPKKSGEYRMILNLKALNESVIYHHFKMDHLNSTLTLVRPDCYFTSLDLSDAYYSVSVAPAHRKYMQFSFNGQFYRYTCLANGVSSAPRTFTKIMKVPLTTLRQQHGIIITAYLDDLLIIADSPEQVLKATHLAQSMLSSLGFTISPQKSVIKPTQSITFLGFDINSHTMLVSVPPTKASDIKQAVQQTMSLQTISVRQFAAVLGKLAATLPGNRYGQLYLKHLEIAKTNALRAHPYDYDTIMTISSSVSDELSWWHDNISHVYRPVFQCNPNLIIFTDASLMGWGCFIPSSKSQFGGRWGQEDIGYDINYLELKAILLSLQTCAKNLKQVHIQVRSDNTTAVTGINRQGSTHSSRCNSITRQIWLWAIDRQLWLSAAHCPGVLNVHADEASRIFDDNTEWMLNKQSFHRICSTFGNPSIDLFASRLNNQVPQYCSWQPDPGAVIIDCFSVDWSQFQLTYSFPPFSLVGRTLQKIARECSTAIIIVPNWPSQPWFPLLRKMIDGQPLKFAVKPRTLALPHDPDQRHPLEGQLHLWACRLCGTTS